MTLSDDEAEISSLREDVDSLRSDLGVDPGGIYANTKVRLDILEARINNPLVPGSPPTVDVSDAFNVKDYGAMGNYSPIDGSGNDDTLAIQAAIDASTGAPRVIYFPAGQYKVLGSLNLTGGGPGLTLFGDGIESQIKFACDGKVGFDCTGAYGITFEKLWIEGIDPTGLTHLEHTANKPASAFLFSRKTGNASAGFHTMRDINIVGVWTKASVITISSEDNTYENCVISNAQPSAHVISNTDQNALDITSDFAIFPTLWSGGNTTSLFTNCQFISLTLTGDHTSCMIFTTGFRHLGFVNCFFQGGDGGFAAIRIYNDSGSSGGTGGTALYLTACSGELQNLDHIIYLDANTTLSQSNVEMYSSGDVYGASGSTINSCKFSLTGSSSYLIDADTLLYSEVNASTSSTVRARTQAIGNRIYCHTDTGDSHSFPADSRLNEYFKETILGDLVKRTYKKIGFEGTGSRLQTHHFESRIHKQTVQVLSDTSGSLAVDVNNGCVVKAKLIGNVTISAPTGFNALSNTIDEGISLEYRLEQDSTGGRTMDFSALTTVTWSPNLNPGAINIIAFRFYPTDGWKQIYTNTAILPNNTVILSSTDNGTTDDSAKIQAALTSVSAYGGKVYLVAGTYKIANQIIIPSNCSLIGAGRELTILNSTLSSSIADFAYVPIAALWKSYTSGTVLTTLNSANTAGSPTISIDSLLDTVTKTGTSPPTVVITGQAAATSAIYLRIECTTLGTLGTARFRVSIDGGTTYVTSNYNGASPYTTSNGITITWPSGTYAVNNVWTAQPGRIAPGRTLEVSGATSSTREFHGNTYTIKAVSGSGPFTITLDRPVVWSLIANDRITARDGQPHDILVSDMTIQGGGIRLWEFGGTLRCWGKRLLFKSISVKTDTDWCTSFDSFGYLNGWEDCEWDGHNCTATSGSGAADAQQEAFEYIRCTSHHFTGGAVNAGFVISSSYGTLLKDSIAYSNVIGAQTNCKTSDAEPWNTRIIGGDYSSNTSFGIGIGISGAGTPVGTYVSTTARNNTSYNLVIGTSTGTYFEGDFSATCTSGITYPFVSTTTVGIEIRSGAIVSAGTFQTDNCLTGCIILAGGRLSFQHFKHYGIVDLFHPALGCGNAVGASGGECEGVSVDIRNTVTSWGSLTCNGAGATLKLERVTLLITQTSGTGTDSMSTYISGAAAKMVIGSGKISALGAFQIGSGAFLSLGSEIDLTACITWVISNAGTITFENDMLQLPSIDNGTTSDSTNINSAISILSSCGGILRLLGQSYKSASVITLASNVIIELNPATIITSTIPTTGGQTNSVFYAAPATLSGASDTTTNGTVSAGDITVVLTSVAIGASGANAAIGNTFFIGENNRFFYYIIRAVNTGTKTITLDRPVVSTFASGVSAGLRIVPTNIKILGNGGKIIGTGDRAVGITAGYNCIIDRLIVGPNSGGFFFTDTPVALDTGSRFSDITNCQIDNNLLGLNCVSLESAESCSIKGFQGQRSGSGYAGILLGNTYSCVVDTARVYKCSYGLWLTSGGGADIYGCRNNVINALDASNNATGIYIINGSSFNKFTNTRANFSTSVAIYLGIGTNSAEHTRGNSFVNIDVSNSGDGFQIQGVSSSKRATDTVIENLTANNCTSYGLDVADSFTLINFISRDCTSGAVQQTGDGDSVISGFQMSQSNAGIFWAAVAMSSTGRMRISNGKIALKGASSNHVGISHTAGKVDRSNMITTGDAPNSYAYSAASPATLRDGHAVISTTTTNINSWGQGNVNRGSFTLNGTTTVNVPFADILATDDVSVTKTANGGTPAVFIPIITITSGVGFAVTGGVALDTSVFDYVIR